MGSGGARAHDPVVTLALHSGITPEGLKTIRSDTLKARRILPLLSPAPHHRILNYPFQPPLSILNFEQRIYADSLYLR